MVLTNKFLRSIEVIETDSATEGLKGESHATYLFNGKRLRAAWSLKARLLKQAVM